MPRQPRHFLPGVPVHIIHRGNNRGPLFFGPADRSLLTEILAKAIKAHGVAVHAYVFMSNHLHVLASPETESSIPLAMRQVALGYAKHINRHQKRTGSLWEGRYRATLIDSERYLFTCMRYIELNPVRAGIVREPREFRWSSHGANAYGEDDPLVTPHLLFRDLGGTWSDRRTAYRALFHEAPSNDVIDDIRPATQFGWPLGSSAFATRVARTHGGRAAPLRRRHARSYVPGT